VDLFSGVGGLSLGLEQAGFDLVASVEYDAVHPASPSLQFPLTEMLVTSVADVTGDQIRAAARRSVRTSDQPRLPHWDGEIDLVAGGPPCQGFSWIGKRRVDDERNDLIFHFWRVVQRATASVLHHGERAGMQAVSPGAPGRSPRTVSDIGYKCSTNGLERGGLPECRKLAGLFLLGRVRI